MSGRNIGDSLIESCEELMNKRVISKDQYRLCVQGIGSSGLRESMAKTEDEIMSSSRINKENKYNEFINSLNDLMKKTFEKKEQENTSDNPDNNIIRECEEILNQIELLSNRVIIWIQDLSLKRFENKEDGNYQNLIYLYNKIDTNRKEMIEIEKQIKTLEQKDISQEDKLFRETEKFKSQRNILISLVIFIIITIAIIFLIYFI